MTGEIRRIPFEEFSSNVRAFLELVISKHKAFMVEKEPGEVIVVKPASITPAKSKTRRHTAKRTEADREAFLSSFGGWSDMDTDAFMRKVYESRNIPSRPPVEL